MDKKGSVGIGERIMIIINEITLDDPLAGRIRIFLINETSWFSGEDIAKSFGFKKPVWAVKKFVSDENRRITVCNTMKEYNKIPIIDIFGVDELCSHSKHELRDNIYRRLERAREYLQSHTGYCVNQIIECKEW